MRCWGSCTMCSAQTARRNGCRMRRPMLSSASFPSWPSPTFASAFSRMWMTRRPVLVSLQLHEYCRKDTRLYSHVYDIRPLYVLLWPSFVMLLMLWFLLSLPEGARLAALCGKLASNDEQIYAHMEEMGLKTQYFAFRWITLLFTQDLSLPGEVLLFFRTRTLSLTLSVCLSVCLSLSFLNWCADVRSTLTNARCHSPLGLHICCGRKNRLRDEPVCCHGDACAGGDARRGLCHRHEAASKFPARR